MDGNELKVIHSLAGFDVQPFAFSLLGVSKSPLNTIFSLLAQAASICSCEAVAPWARCRKRAAGAEEGLALDIGTTDPDTAAVPITVPFTPALGNGWPEGTHVGTVVVRVIVIISTHVDSVVIQAVAAVIFADSDGVPDGKGGLPLVTKDWANELEFAEIAGIKEDAVGVNAVPVSKPPVEFAEMAGTVTEPDPNGALEFAEAVGIVLEPVPAGMVAFDEGVGIESDPVPDARPVVFAALGIGAVPVPNGVVALIEDAGREPVPVALLEGRGVAEALELP